jgi:hypothetical protein
MENARRFLARAVPWPINGEGWWIDIYQTFRPANHKAGTRLPMFGKPFKEMTPAINFIERRRDEPFCNFYVCMSAQSQVSSKPTASGWHNAMKSAENAMRLRTFWIDVDVDKRHFATQGEAVAAALKFIKVLGLPPPTYIVTTSLGFQLHWTLEDAIDPETWSPLAHALANATRMTGFVPLDAGLIHDRARLMRIPGTTNWNHTPPMPVQLTHVGDLVTFDRMQGVLAPFLISGIKQTKNQTSTFSGLAGHTPAKVFAEVTGGEHSLSAGIEDEGSRPSIDDVARGGCGFIADALQTGGKGFAEPQWRDSLRVACWTSDPADAAHRLSKDHEEYTPESTDEKLARAMADRKRRDLGWPMCDTIRIAGAIQCAACPHLSALKSPLHWATPAVGPSSQSSQSSQSTGATPPGGASMPPNFTVSGKKFGWLPLGYTHNDSGYVYKEPTKEDEEKQLVCGLPIWDATIEYQGPADGTSSTIYFTAGLDKLRERRIRVPYAALSSTDKLLSCLQDQSMGLRDAYQKRFKDLMNSFIEELRNGRLEASQAENFGWAHDAGKPNAFVYGRVRWNCAGNTMVGVPDYRLDESYGQFGTLDNWKAACRLVTDQQMPALDALIAASFAAPLVLLTGHAGMVLSAFSLDSGVSKTSAMRVAQAVWSNPGTTMGGLDDTANYVNGRLGVLRHLPFFYDEMHVQEHTAKFASLIFAMGQGKTKGRMNRAAMLQPVKSFATLLVAASNNSLVHYIIEHTKMTTAGLYRVFEFPVARNEQRIGMITPAVAQQVNGALDQNYGHAGLKYAEFLGRNAASIATEVANTAKDIGEHVKATQDERFWSATLTVLVMGARYANQLGLTHIDEHRLLRFLLGEFYRMRANRQTSSVDVTHVGGVAGYVAEYLNTRRQQMIVTDKLWTSTTKPPPSYVVRVTFPEAGRVIQGNICVRVGSEAKVLRFSKADFKAWCKLRGLSSASMLEQIRTVLQARQPKSAIAQHTPLQGTFREELVEIDLGKFPELIAL